MIAAVIALAVALALFAPGLIWVTHRALEAGNRAADAAVREAALQARLQVTTAELATARADVADRDSRLTRLQEVTRDALAARVPDAGVDGLRAALELVAPGAPDAGGDRLPHLPGPGVAGGPAAPAGSAAVPHDDGIVHELR